MSGVLRAWAVATVGSLAVLLALPAAAAVALIQDEQGQPLADVSACHIVDGYEALCATSNKEGRLELPPSKFGKIRLTLPGYLPQLFDALPTDKPIVLMRSAEIWVRLVGPDGAPIEAGEVFLLDPSGERKGPVPANAQGVRVRTLAPGTYSVLARAAGWVQPRSHSVELVSGRVADAQVQLEPAEPDAAD